MLALEVQYSFRSRNDPSITVDRLIIPYRVLLIGPEIHVDTTRRYFQQFSAKRRPDVDDRVSYAIERRPRVIFDERNESTDTVIRAGTGFKILAFSVPRGIVPYDFVYQRGGWN